MHSLRFVQTGLAMINMDHIVGGDKPTPATRSDISEWGDIVGNDETSSLSMASYSPHAVVSPPGERTQKEITSLSEDCRIGIMFCIYEQKVCI